MKLAEMTAAEVEKLPRQTVVVYPIAATEQHGPHLPFFTDAYLCGAVADGVEKALSKEVLLLSVQWLGASAHHLGFAGSLSAELDTHVNLICEPLRCLLDHGFENVFVLNGHGGNVTTYQMALRQLALEYPTARLRAASYWEIACETIEKMLTGPLKRVGHAGEAETALLMAVRPKLVRTQLLADDPPADDPELGGVFVPLDMKHQTRIGAVGYATRATPAQGRRMLKQIIKDVTAAVTVMRQTPKTAKRAPAKRTGSARRPRRKT